MKLRPIFAALSPVMILTFAAGLANAQQHSKAAGGIHDAVSSLTDGQILQIVHVLNEAEIKQAEEALDESDSDAVKQVARMIIADHENSNEQIDDMEDDFDLELEDSPLHDALQSKAEQTHEALQDLDGAAYDCAYLQKQVAQHEEVLHLAKTQLQPQAKNTSVAQFLTAMGPKLESHLDMAKQSMGKTAGCQ